MDRFEIWYREYLWKLRTWAGCFDKEPRPSPYRKAFELVTSATFTHFNNWHTHEDWGSVRGVTEYFPENCVPAENGRPARLYLRRHRDATPAIPFEGGMLLSKTYFKRGMFEARIKTNTHHHWPAFWMYPTAPPWRELDIAEFVPTHSGDLSVSLHTEHDQPYRTYRFSADNRYHSLWHTYTCLWTSSCIEIAVDGLLTVRFTKNIPQELMRILFSVEASPGITQPSYLPLYMDIDYFRHWEVQI